MLRKSAILRRIPAIIMIQNSETDGAAYLGHFQKSLLGSNLRLVHFKMFNNEHLRLLPQCMSLKTWQNKPFYCTHPSATNSASSDAAIMQSIQGDSSSVGPLPSCVMSPCDETCDAKIDYHVVGVISLGGPMSAADDANYPFIQKVMRLMKSAVEEDVPVLGICLGSQMLSRALGGVVTKAPIGEMGFVPQTVEPVARYSTPEEAVAAKSKGLFNWFAGRKQLPTYHWHNDTFTLPPTAVRVASGEFCPEQAFQVPHKYVLGVQWHPDIDNGKAYAWLKADGIDKEDPAAPLTPGLVSCGEFLKSLEAQEMMRETQSLADDIYKQWFEGVFKCKADRYDEIGRPSHEDRDELLSPPLTGSFTSPLVPALKEATV